MRFISLYAWSACAMTSRMMAATGFFSLMSPEIMPAENAPRSMSPFLARPIEPVQYASSSSLDAPLSYSSQ